jgi:hypothetical protein
MLKIRSDHCKVRQTNTTYYFRTGNIVGTIPSFFLFSSPCSLEHHVD